MTGIVLRPYQDKAVAEVRSAFQEGHDSVLMQIPTGGGKTLTAGFIVGGAAARGNPAWFICNRIELVEQTALAFDKLGLTYGIIAAGYTGNPRELIQIASIDTLKARLKKGVPFRLPKLRVWDECRSVGSAGWTAVYEILKAEGGMDLGLDATPIRLDGKGLDTYFSALVCGPQYSELMALGALVPFDVYGPTTPDLTGVKTKGGEFDQEAVETIFDKPKMVGDIIEHYLQLAPGKLGITFAVSRKHSEHLAQCYRDAGVPAVHLDGDTDKGERKRAVNAFRRREIMVLCNVDLFTAGFDVPGVEVITMARPTQSLSFFLQQAGRGSRPDAVTGKDRCILLDHAGNWTRHGLPDQDRTWSLAGRKKGERKKKEDEETLGVKQCKSCYAVFPPGPSVCPRCGAVQEVASREVEAVDGVLTKIGAAEAAMIKAKAQKELKGAKSLDQLLAIEKERGYKPGWAENTFKARKQAQDRILSARFESQAAAYRR